MHKVEEHKIRCIQKMSTKNSEIFRIKLDPGTIEREVIRMWSDLNQNIEDHKRWLHEKQEQFALRLIANKIDKTAGLLRKVESTIVKVKANDKILSAWRTMVESINVDVMLNILELKNAINDLTQHQVPRPSFFDSNYAGFIFHLSRQKRLVQLQKKLANIELKTQKNLTKFKFEIESFNRGVISVTQRKRIRKLHLNDILKMIDDLSESGSPLTRSMIHLSSNTI